MRLRTLLLGLFLLGGCCGDDTSMTTPYDFATGAACPEHVEQANGAHCDYGVDHTCRSPLGHDCQCLCTGYWSCDAARVVCDPDLGDVGD